MSESRQATTGQMLLAAGLGITAVIYATSLSGGFVFDDIPNIVENPALFPARITPASLYEAALSSPSSEFARPLSSLSITLNALVGGGTPYSLRLGNLILHLANGVLVYLLAQRMLRATGKSAPGDWVAGLIAFAWLVLPINSSPVLLIVQRMESLANLFVLAALAGYVAARQYTLQHGGRSLRPCLWIVAGTLIGVSAKETAVLIPLYAAVIECSLFGFRLRQGGIDRRLLALFGVTLLLPFAGGLAWLLPRVLPAEYWQFRDFSLGERLLTETRVITSYVQWALLPRPADISFYHDDIVLSKGLLTPWTTFTSILLLAALGAAGLLLRRQWPLASAGLLLFLAAHTLTGTVLPLEIAFEHRNYFASFGLLLVIIPPLAGTTGPLPRSRMALLCALLLGWTSLTALTAYAWGNPLRMASELAARAPQSPRAQYDLGRQLAETSAYRSDIGVRARARAQMEKAMQLANGSVMPELGLIALDVQAGQVPPDRAWDSALSKLAAKPPDAQDANAIAALAVCVRNRICEIPQSRMQKLFEVALEHPLPSGYLLRVYGDYVLNSSGDTHRALQLFRAAVQAEPSVADHRDTLLRMLMALGRFDEAQAEFSSLTPRQRTALGLTHAARLEACIAARDVTACNPVPAHP
jgi:protein O-mannosyl-transferase